MSSSLSFLYIKKIITLVEFNSIEKSNVMSITLKVSLLLDLHSREEGGGQAREYTEPESKVGPVTVTGS